MIYKQNALCYMKNIFKFYMKNAFYVFLLAETTQEQMLIVKPNV